MLPPLNFLDVNAIHPPLDTFSSSHSVHIEERCDVASVQFRRGARNGKKFKLEHLISVQVYGYFVPYTVLFLTALQVTLFYTTPRSQFGLNVPIVPCTSGQDWRLLTYAFAHADEDHLWTNMLSQLFSGIFVEMWEGSARFQAIYWFSVFGGALAEAAQHAPYNGHCRLLIGASCGVYGLFLLGLSSLCLNFREFELRWLILFGYAVLIPLETWRSWTSEADNVSHWGHAIGAICGLLIGVLIGRNERIYRVEIYMWWLALFIVVPSVLTLVHMAYR